MKFVNKYIKKSFKMGKMHLIIVLKWMNEREKRKYGTITSR